MKHETRRLGRILGTVLLLGAVLLSPRAWAGPPFATDDPEPTELGHWEIYLGGTVLGIEGDTNGTGPSLGLNYGAWKDVQLSVAPQAAFNAPTGGPRAFGLGDTLVGAKIRFLHESPGTPQAAVFPQVNLPTGDPQKGLGSGQAQVLLPLWLQKSWGPWTSYGGGGYWINPGTGNRNWVFAGWEIQRDLSKTLTLGGEVFYHGANAVGERGSWGYNLGGILNLDGAHHVVLSVGRDFVNPEDRLTGFLAFEWTLPGND